MKILITGSRHWTNLDVIETAILAAKPDVVIHGAAQGADFIAEAICKRHQINYRGYPAKWKTYGKPAGPRRNVEMLHKEHLEGGGFIDLVLAFPMKGSIGTYDMIELAEHAGIKVIVDTRFA